MSVSNARSRSSSLSSTSCWGVGLLPLCGSSNVPPPLPRVALGMRDSKDEADGAHEAGRAGGMVAPACPRPSATGGCRSSTAGGAAGSADRKSREKTSSSAAGPGPGWAGEARAERGGGVANAAPAAAAAHGPALPAVGPPPDRAGVTGRDVEVRARGKAGARGAESSAEKSRRPLSGGKGGSVGAQCAASAVAGARVPTPADRWRLVSADGPGGGGGAEDRGSRSRKSNAAPAALLLLPAALA